MTDAQSDPSEMRGACVTLAAKARMGPFGICFGTHHEGRVNRAMEATLS